MPALTISKGQSVAAQTTNSGHARGSADAPVTLEEFGDFQCPPCGRLAGPIQEIEKDYGMRLCVIFRNFPFAIHEHAMTLPVTATSRVWGGDPRRIETMVPSPA